MFLKGLFETFCFGLTLHVMKKLLTIFFFLTVFLHFSNSLSGEEGKTISSKIKGDGIRLPEVIVRPKNYSMLHLLCYVREYSIMSTEYDTIQLFREKTVDFMIPSKKKKKGGWLSPRVLASRSAYRFANFEGLDSVSDRCTQHFSWSDRISLFDRYKFDIDPVSDSIVFAVDFLNQKNSRKLMPSIIELLESPLEKFIRFETTYYLSDLSSRAVTPENLTRFDLDVRSGQGFRQLNKNFTTKDSVFIDTHAEFYVINRDYLNDTQAKHWKNSPPKDDEIDIVPPPEASPLPPLYAQIALRAGNIDHAKIRRESKNDPLLIGPMYDNFMTKNQNIVGKLWDKIKKLPNWLQKHI